MTVQAPRHQASHPDRDLQCQESIEPVMQEILAEANMHGWGTSETLNAMEEVLRHLRRAYAEDPDPADDPGVSNFHDPEPSNDWPAANP
jgi:hypothetical protein